MKVVLSIIFLVLVAFPVGSLADDEKPNCKITTHTLFTSGKKHLDIEEVHAYSRDECKYKAQVRKLSNIDDEDVQKVKVFFAYRDLAILR